MAPAPRPTGRALTKGIWSFFQNKYKNHVERLDPHRAAARWKCHVEPHDVGVIKGLGVPREHPVGQERGDTASQYHQAVGCASQSRPRVEVGDGSEREGRNQLPTAHRDDTAGGCFLCIWKSCLSCCFRNCGWLLGGQRSSLQGRGCYAPSAAAPGCALGVSRTSLVFYAIAPRTLQHLWAHCDLLTLLYDARREIKGRSS